MVLRVGVCGLGFMGRTHLSAYANARAAGRDVVVTAVADRNANKRRGELEAGGNIATGGAGERLFDPDAVEAYADPFALVRSPAVDLVSICTHTPTHVELALAALACGKHVLVEKPVALASRDVERLVEARDAAGREVVPGMCIRAWPGWRELKPTIASGRLGALRSLALRRLSPAPGWGSGFYGDPAKTGGALFDLHVHDVDFAHWCLGPARAVTSVGTRDHVFTTYHRDGPAAPAVVAEGGWDLPAQFPFHMGYTAVFERGTLVFDSGRAEPLVETPQGEAPRALALAPGTGYEHEILALVDGLARGRLDPAQAGALEDAVVVMRTVEAEARSLAEGRPVEV
jgi:predicted dehydrogenase